MAPHLQDILGRRLQQVQISPCRSVGTKDRLHQDVYLVGKAAKAPKTSGKCLGAVAVGHSIQY